MSISEVEIYNFALSACGADLGVGAPDERSREADLCRLWYEEVRDSVIASAPWPSVRAYARLALLAEREMEDDWTPGDPAPQWPRRYAVPVDLLHPYHFTTYERFEYSGGAISTAAESPVLLYNKRVPESYLWDQGLKETVIHMLAARIARPLTGSQQIVNENFQLAYQKATDMKAATANNQDMQTDDLPDWLQARGTDLRTPYKFLYPFQVLSMPGVTSYGQEPYR